MRRPLLALALLLGTVSAAAQQASTAGTDLPASTAVYRSTSVSGATLVSMEQVIVAGQITTVKPRLRGTNLLTRVVTARFGSAVPVVCTAGPLELLNVITGLGAATYTCVGFLERADRPRPLLVTAV